MAIPILTAAGNTAAAEQNKASQVVLDLDNVATSLKEAVNQQQQAIEAQNRPSGVPGQVYRIALICRDGKGTEITDFEGGSCFIRGPDPDWYTVDVHLTPSLITQRRTCVAALYQNGQMVSPGTVSVEAHSSLAQVLLDTSPAHSEVRVFLLDLNSAPLTRHK